MSYTEFVDKTVVQLNEVLFYELRDILVDEYIPFAVVKRKDITKEILAEKLCDYFEKIELKTGKSFEKVIEKYTSDLDSIVGDKIAKEPKAKRNEPTPPTPRSRKYYEKACTIKKANKMTRHGLLDYSRLMLCLYTEIIKNDGKVIDDFDFSSDCLNLTRIIDSMRSETGFIGKKAKFDTKEPYAADRSTFIMVIIMFYYIKSKEIIGEY